MARPVKRGLAYFSFDVDLFEDDKLFDIQNDYGCLGESIYVRLLCLVYKNGYYYRFESIDKLAAMLIKSIGNKWIGSKQTVIQVIRALVKVGLFREDLFASNVITSESIQRRYLKACERRQSINNGEFWLLRGEESHGIPMRNKSVNEEETGVSVYNNPIIVYSNDTKTNTNINTNTKERESTPPRICCGEFENVLLTEEELKKLAGRFTEEETKKAIEELSVYMKSKGKAYKDHYATLINWITKNVEAKAEKEKRSKAYTPINSYTAHNRKYTDEELNAMIENLDDLEI